jgi:sarcosine oxidase subunit gamma
MTPLGGMTPRRDEIGGFTMREVIDRAMMSLAARAGQDKATAKIIAALVCGKAPGPEQFIGPGQFIGGMSKTKLAAFWYAPGQWMLDAPLAIHDDITAILPEKYASKVSVTEQTDGWCRFEIEGKEIDRLCSLLCAVDTRGFTVGSASRTTIEHIGVFILRMATRKMQIIAPRSSAESLHHALITAMRSSIF